MQGCNLRCGFCHNPESQDSSGGTEYTAEEIIEKATRFREYFGKGGGITASGGEPLLQAEFVKELFTLAHREGINTCLDTAGNGSSKDLRPLLSVCDRVLLDMNRQMKMLAYLFVLCHDLKKLVGSVLRMTRHKPNTEISVEACNAVKQLCEGNGR